MITERMIEAAAAKYVAGRPKDLLTMERYASFVDGAQWAQQEFVKSLWHDASEEPDAKRDAWLVMQTGKDLIEVHKYGGFNKDGGQTWQQQAERGFVIRWAYLSDILPKKGGGE